MIFFSVNVTKMLDHLSLWKEQVAIYLLFPISQQKKVVSQHWSQI